jgi:hypothetical protein
MTDLAVLVLGTVAGSLVFGVSGFAFALTASAIRLQRCRRRKSCRSPSCAR